MKHANPCGIAVGADLAQAHRLANACDPASAFGGVIAVNGTVTGDWPPRCAEIFTEVIIAPDFEPAALDILARPQEPAGAALPAAAARPGHRVGRPVSGGLLMQTADRVGEPGDVPAGWQLAAGEPVSERRAGRPGSSPGRPAAA